MNTSRKCVALVQMCRRYANKAACDAKEVPSAKFEKLKAKQQHFTCDDGTPVYLKGGFGDKALYQLTLVLLAVGLGLAGETLFKLTFKKE